jgi:hypothetical protein
MVLVNPRKSVEEEGSSLASPRLCTHVSQLEGIHLIVVSVKQKTQGLPGSGGKRQITGEVTKDPGP